MVFPLSRRLSALLGRLADARGETSYVLAIPGRRCRSSVNTKAGRRLGWLGGEFGRLVVLGLGARDCVDCLNDVGFISIRACVGTCVTGEHGARRLARAPGSSRAASPAPFACIKQFL